MPCGRLGGSRALLNRHVNIRTLLSRSVSLRTLLSRSGWPMQVQVCPKALLRRPGCIQLAEPYLLHGAPEQVDQLVVGSIPCLLDCLQQSQNECTTRVRRGNSRGRDNFPLSRSPFHCYLVEGGLRSFFKSSHCSLGSSRCLSLLPSLLLHVLLPGCCGLGFLLKPDFVETVLLQDEFRSTGMISCRGSSLPCSLRCLVGSPGLLFCGGLHWCVRLGHLQQRRNQ
jgi:hypothetical protein